MVNKRNDTFDAIKAFAILLVVYAHSIQYLSGYDYWNNPIFKFIYSFHMPLFFMISGFFCTSAFKLSWKDFLVKKSISLLVPCIVWTMFFECLNFQGWHEFYSAIVNPFHWKLWFLRGLFIVQLIAYICIRLAEHVANRKRCVILLAVAMSAMVYILPFMSVPRIMMPMFWIGYFIRLKYDWFKKNYYWVTLASLLVFLWVYPFWNAEILEMYAGAKLKIYEVFFGEADMTDLLKMIYRVLIGVCGSITVIASMHMIKKVPKWISTIGVSTAAIYIWQSFILEYLMGIYVPPIALIYHWPQWIVLGCYLPIVSAVVIVMCIFLREVVKKNNYLSMLLIGDTTIIAEKC